MVKETVGKKALELQQLPDEHTAEDIQREVHKDFIDNLFLCINRNKSHYDDIFYVVVETKKERLINNIIRNFFYARLTCPTPNYDQTVYQYDPNTEQVQYIWTIPDRETAHMLKDNILLIHPEEKELLQMVLDFDDGTLLKICKGLNNEEYDSNKIAKG